ncbi:MAG: hypothetical protein GX146_06120 [Myxococcales bacterium]|jgi:peptidyl-prolyl cis-trans isomerase D|nr:hypothetical protein [Myxococcales bacterium]
MLDYFRKNVGGLLGALIISLLVLAFVLSFGSQSRGWGKGSTLSTTIKVEGAEITDAVFRYAMNMSATDNLSTESAEYSALRQFVARGLIERQILLNLAEKAGISASTEEAADTILNGDYYITRSIAGLLEELSFQIQFGRIPLSALPTILIQDGHRAPMQSFKGADGKFDVEMFNRYIRYRLQTKEEDFVEQQRLELIALRMRQLLASGIVVSEREARAAYDAESNTASLSFLKFTPEVFAQRHQPTEAETTAWIDANAEAIQRYYETNKYKYTGLDKMANARHILIKQDAAADDDQKAEVRKAAEAILADVKKPGASFADLAREHSEDPGSAAKGGELGFHPKGVMVAAFDEAMFAMAPGEISDLVETEYGFHIIQLIAIREGDIALADATAEIAETLINEERGKQLARDSADKALASLREGTDIAAAFPEDAETELPPHLQVSVQTSGSFTPADANISGIGEARELVGAAFALPEGTSFIDSVMEIGGSFYVAALHERTHPSDAEFKTRKDEIRDRLLAMKQSTWLKDRMATLLEERLRNGQIQVDFPLALGAEPTAEAPPAAPAPADAPAEIPAPADAAAE